MCKDLDQPKQTIKDALAFFHDYSEGKVFFHVNAKTCACGKDWWVKLPGSTFQWQPAELQK